VSTSVRASSRASAADVLRGAFPALTVVLSAAAAAFDRMLYGLVDFAAVIGAGGGAVIRETPSPSGLLLALPIATGLLFAYGLFRASPWVVAAGAGWVAVGLLVQLFIVQQLSGWGVEYAIDPRIAWLAVSIPLALIAASAPQDRSKHFARLRAEGGQDCWRHRALR
jgi:hypothetical protein